MKMKSSKEISQKLGYTFGETATTDYNHVENIL